MRVRISLPDDDVEFLDRYAERRGFASRSTVLHKAIRLLRASELGDEYEDAWADWEATGDSARWEPTASDGTAGFGAATSGSSIVVAGVPVTPITDR